MKIKEYVKNFILGLKWVKGFDKIKYIFLAFPLFIYYKYIKKFEWQSLGEILRRLKVVVEFNGFKFECRKNTKDIHHVLPWYEKELTEFLLKIKGKVFIDIGAHIGRYTILLSKNFEKIIAIEADPYNFSQLVRNIILNKLEEKVIPLNIAITDENRKVKLYLDKESEGTHSIVIKRSEKYLEVLGLKLDFLIQLFDIDPKDIGLIKIDIEGAEYFALKGMEKILREGNPIIVVEIWEDSKYKEKTIELLKNFNYKIKNVLNNVNYVFTK